MNVDIGRRFHIRELIFAYADTVTSTLSDGTMPSIAYDAILGVASLPIGFLINRSKAGKSLFSATVKTIGAHISAGAKMDIPIDKGGKTFLILRAVFEDPLILSGDTDDTLTIQINDNMSGLLQFTASARGNLEG